MNDKQLRAFARSFRKGMIDKQSSEDCCAMVCWPLAGLLSAHGVEAQAIEGETIWGVNHVWLRLPDGRVLDPTIDQFNRVWLKKPFPKVYLGKPIQAIHGSPL